jgi:hypothetical protein
MADLDTTVVFRTACVQIHGPSRPSRRERDPHVAIAHRTKKVLPLGQRHGRLYGGGGRAGAGARAVTTVGERRRPGIDGHSGIDDTGGR